MSLTCYHCLETVPKGITLEVVIAGKKQPMCCLGCQAVANVIVDNNLNDYYRFRTEPADKSEAIIPEQLKRNELLDDAVLQDEFIYSTDDFKETILSIDGINCAACAWLIEMQLAKINGVIKIQVNATSQRATIRWEGQQLKLSEILLTIEKIGYHAHPFKASNTEQRNKKRSKTFIKRLGISGILMMQVMMIATGLYFGAFSDMSAHNLIYLRWISLLLTLPIITYGALPFYLGAISALKAKRLSMDVPVSIAIILAFSASLWATYSQQGEVYFESVSMFTFLLLIGKFLEFRARTRAAEVSENLLKLMPMTATKIVNDKEIFIAAKNLQPEDLIIVKPGETIPADGVITYGSSQLNEAMLSGEQLPVNKTINEKVFAGTVNGDGSLIINVKLAGQFSFLNQLIRLSESSQAHKPQLAKLSDKIAQYFVAVILFTACATAIYWQVNLPEQALWITISVLVATCPCALSLATPTALTCATTKLHRHGILIKSGHVMETIPQINCFAFDKTGTLTSGKFAIIKTLLIDKQYNEIKVKEISAALESYSEHPLAQAFTPFRNTNDIAGNINVNAGNGVAGLINNKQYSIGKPSWLIDEQSEHWLNVKDAQCLLVEHVGDKVIPTSLKVIACFTLEDEIRSDAKKLIDVLKHQKIKTILLSGDNKAGCEKVQNLLGLDSVYSQLSASNKLTLLKEQQKTHTVAMLGDGINDTPVFGAAHVSVAMGCGADIAKSGADVILLNNKLSSISILKTVANKTRSIIWQNYLWAFAYNAIVLPLAVMGYITPYMAVIGMSVSSLLVISNSLRLLR